MQCPYACGSSQHAFSRRQFLGGLGGAAAGALSFGFAGMIQPAAASELARQQKRVVLIWLNGGVSQLETWDPKPGTDTGGPFQAIPTTVPGIHISELLPYTASQMHRLAVIRGINTKEDDHGLGSVIMHTGRRQDPAMQYPHLGSAMAKLLASKENPLPGYIHITPGGGGGLNKKDAAFLGPRFAPVALGNGQAPANLLRPANLTESADHQRDMLRQKLDHDFLNKRRTAETEAYAQSFEQAAQLMARKEVFDVSKESPRSVDLYGTHDFGRHCLMARRLLEAGVTFVKVTHTNYDTHHENFDFHLQQLEEFDRPFATLLDDLAQRGMLESTLVVVMSEFGRTPRVNHLYGRDHWSKAWSIALGGCGIQGGALVGKTNANGTAVIDREVNGGHLFHTYFRAVGLDPKKKYYVNEQPIPMTDPAASAITEVLA
jgi:uncharacterized protein (DUF1501 family)